MKKKVIVLTKEQMSLVDKLYDVDGVTAIKELVEKVFPDIEEKYRDGPEERKPWLLLIM